jgi:hypothetical protein
MRVLPPVDGSSAPSVRTVCSIAITLKPLPYRTGSTWVSSSGWNDEVIATPYV